MAQSPKFDTSLTTLGKFVKTNFDMIWTEMTVGMFAKENPFYIGNRVKLITGAKTKQLLPSISSNHIIQPANSKAWNPTSDAVTFSQRTLDPLPFKADIEVDWQAVEQEWLASEATAKIGKLANESNPFPTMEEYLINQLIKQADADKREAIVLGDTSSLTPHLKVFNGEVILIQAAITAGLAPVNTTGGVGNVQADMIKMIAQIGKAYRGKPLVMVLASDVYQHWTTELVSSGSSAFVMAMSSKASSVDALRMTVTGFPNIQVIEEPFYPDGAMVLTTPDNLCFGVDDQGTDNQLRFQMNRRIVEFMMDGTMGLQFRSTVPANSDALALVVNDVF